MVLVKLDGYIQKNNNGKSIPHQLGFKGDIYFGGVKLTYTQTVRKGAWSLEQEPEPRPEPRGQAEACRSSFKEKYTTPQWAGISVAIG